MYFRRLGRLQQDMDQLFDALTGRLSPLREPVWRTARLFPLLNVKKSAAGYEVTAEIPGMSIEDLEIQIEGETLTLKGERKPTSVGEDASYHRRERATGKFQRSITLPGPVDAENVKATYRNGVLTVTLPHEKAVGPKQIAVKREE